MATRIYTKTGDDGSTGLFGGARVQKNAPRIEAYGTVDELNAILGIVLTQELPEDLRAELTATSAHLFTLGADLATPLDPPPTYKIPRITEEHVLGLERRIDRIEATLPALKAFILPGGVESAATLHLARTVCRRAERAVVTLGETENTGEYVLRYLNRMSDWLFVSARYANAWAGFEDVPWNPND
ncbi:MAG: cob(I)yrinic acid a,c-diamide adenosyltransferase [bacterium]|nr:cob(I)yrinic acid a,c-diamide adenosyltransferase [bacterium]